MRVSLDRLSLDDQDNIKQGCSINTVKSAKEARALIISRLKQSDVIGNEVISKGIRIFKTPKNGLRRIEEIRLTRMAS